MYSKVFDATNKGVQVYPMRTICEVHRDLYDEMVILLAKDHPEIFNKLLPLLEESYLTGIKIAKKLIEYNIDRPDNTLTDMANSIERRTKRLKLIAELNNLNIKLREAE